MVRRVGFHDFAGVGLPVLPARIHGANDHGTNGRAQSAAVDMDGLQHDVRHVDSDDDSHDAAIGDADDMAVCQD